MCSRGHCKERQLKQVKERFKALNVNKIQTISLIG